jgi:hypothetical protein
LNTNLDIDININARVLTNSNANSIINFNANNALQLRDDELPAGVAAGYGSVGHDGSEPSFQKCIDTASAEMGSQRGDLDQRGRAKVTVRCAVEIGRRWSVVHIFCTLFPFLTVPSCATSSGIASIFGRAEKIGS